MDKRIFEGICLTIDINKTTCDTLPQLCLFPPCDYDDIQVILITGNIFTCPDFKLFLSILNIYFPHLTPKILTEKEVEWEYVQELREDDIEVEWWLKI